MSSRIKVLVWHEFRHEKKNPAVRAIYPDGMHRTIAAGLEQYGGFDVRTATLDDPEQGITPEVLQWADVVTWWGHCAHGDVPDDKAMLVRQAVLEGLGLLVLLPQKLVATTV